MGVARSEKKIEEFEYGNQSKRPFCCLLSMMYDIFPEQLVVDQFGKLDVLVNTMPEFTRDALAYENE